jgi:predicted metal-binding protein
VDVDIYLSQPLEILERNLRFTAEFGGRMFSDEQNLQRRGFGLLHALTKGSVRTCNRNTIRIIFRQ